jgi:hypothetical protein
MEWVLMFKTQNVSIIHKFQPRDSRRDDEFLRRIAVWERRHESPFDFFESEEEESDEEEELEVERIARDEAFVKEINDRIAGDEATLNDTNAFFKRADKPVFHSFKQNN